MLMFLVGGVTMMGGTLRLLYTKVSGLKKLTQMDSPR